MQISLHYTPYAEKTAIVVTNNEVARIYLALDREVEEGSCFRLETLEHTSEQKDQFSEKQTAIVDSKEALYKGLGQYLEELLQGDTQRIILCAPEINREVIFSSLPESLTSTIKDIIPKNLAALPPEQIIRILHESI